jgi:hypothetical protein
MTCHFVAKPLTFAAIFLASLSGIEAAHAAIDLPCAKTTLRVDDKKILRQLSRFGSAQAQDALQHAFLTVHERCLEGSIPRNPQAFLSTVAWNAARRTAGMETRASQREASFAYTNYPNNLSPELAIDKKRSLSALTKRAASVAAAVHRPSANPPADAGSGNPTDPSMPGPASPTSTREQLNSFDKLKLETFGLDPRLFGQYLSDFRRATPVDQYIASDVARSLDSRLPLEVIAAGHLRAQGRTRKDTAAAGDITEDTVRSYERRLRAAVADAPDLPTSYVGGGGQSDFPWKAIVMGIGLAIILANLKRDRGIKETFHQANRYHAPNSDLQYFQHYQRSREIVHVRSAGA